MGSSSSLRILLVLLSLVLVTGGSTAPVQASGRTFHVDQQAGSDERTPAEAQSPRTPWRTLERALEDLRPGDVVVAAPGSYALSVQGLEFDPPVTIRGRAGGRLRAAFQAAAGFVLEGFSYPSVTVVEEASRITFREGESTGGFLIRSGSSRVTLQGMTIGHVDDPDQAPWENAVAVEGASHVVISDSLFHHNPGDAIHLSGVRHVTIQGNRFEENGPWNAVVDRDRHSDVLQVMAGRDIAFLDNLVVANQHVLMIKADKGAIADLLVEGNWLAHNGGYAVQLWDAEGVVLRSNLYLCNGTLWREGCDGPAEYAVLTGDHVGWREEGGLPSSFLRPHPPRLFGAL